MCFWFLFLGKWFSVVFFLFLGKCFSNFLFSRKCLLGKWIQVNEGKPLYEAYKKRLDFEESWRTFYLSLCKRWKHYSRVIINEWRLAKELMRSFTSQWVGKQLMLPISVLFFFFFRSVGMGSLSSISSMNVLEGIPLINHPEVSYNYSYFSILLNLYRYDSRSSV